MKEHPIPQDITGYRFHIVGNMTLKQFGELLLATIICFGIFSTNLPAIIMWPLIVFVALLGVVAAFIPIEERPLSHWIATFYGILYKPTQFFWKRANNIPEAFLYKANEENLIQVKEIDLTPIRRERIKEFLSTSTDQDEGDFTYEERSSMQQVLSLFETSGQLYQPTGQVEPSKPDLRVRVRTIRQVPTESDTALPSEEVVAEEALPQPEISHLVAQSAQETPPPVPAPLIATVTPDADQKSVFLETQQVAQNIDIPQQQSIAVSREENEKAQAEIEADLVSDSSEKSFVQSEALATEQQESAPAQAATFNASLPFPDKPTVPNKLVGMVLSANKELIPGAIVEIQTPDGQVARAVKTNALGQFFVTTPLRNGKYNILAEKDDYQFQPQNIELKGKIVDPLEITSN